MDPASSRYWHHDFQHHGEERRLKLEIRNQPTPILVIDHLYLIPTENEQQRGRREELQ